MTKCPKKRKRAGKSNRDLNDIITLISGTLPEELPIFVARDLQKLPPVTFDHIDVTRLLKDIIVLQKELRDIQEKYASDVQYATVSELEQLKIEINCLKERQAVSYNAPYVNTKRGGFYLQDSMECNSGPMGLGHSANKSLSPEGSHIKCTSNELPDSPSLSYAKVAACDVIPVTQPSDDTNKQARVEATGLGTAVTTDPVTPRCASNITMPKCDVAESKENADQNEWIEVRKKAKFRQSRFTGTKGKAPVGENSKFKAADVKIPLYIYNVSIDTSAEDIQKYIQDKTSIVVKVEKNRMKETKDYSSYKIQVPRQKLHLFESDDFWPADIYFRKYIMFRNKASDIDKGNGKTNSEQNG